MRATDRKKARDRTRQWRKARQEAATPEAREIDRAVVAALVHVVVEDRRRGLLPPELVPAVAHVAAFILEEGRRRKGAFEAVEARLQDLMEAQEVKRAHDMAAIRRTPE